MFRIVIEQQVIRLRDSYKVRSGLVGPCTTGFTCVAARILQKKDSTGTDDLPQWPMITFVKIWDVVICTSHLT